MRRCPFITFEGPIAAGKTTLAGLLAQHISAHLLLEEFEGNDFLSDFYSNQQRWGLAMQLWFLAARRQQTKNLPTTLDEPVVADYSHRKDGIFARMLLVDREFELFSRLDALLDTNAVRPNVIVYLDASNDVLLDRIRGRSRRYEQNIGSGYIDSLRSAYAYEEHLLTGSNDTVVRYDTSGLDLQCTDQMNHFYSTVLEKCR
jgi:deoxyadenosine/deoxycytidine kinase